MGSYGIGVSRLPAAIIEAKYNNQFMKWPKSVTPFHVAIINLGKSGDEADKKSNDIYNCLRIMVSTHYWMILLKVLQVSLKILI